MWMFAFKFEVRTNSGLRTRQTSAWSTIGSGVGWGVMQERVYQSPIQNVDDLKQRLISVWAELKQSVIDKAIDQWRPRLRAYVRACGQYFEQLINWNNCLSVERFLPRDAMLSAVYATAIPSVCPSVCLSVRPSVTRVDQSKTVEAKIMQFSPHSSPIPLVSSRNSDGFPLNGGVKQEWGRKNSQFSANSSPYLRNGTR